MAATIFQATLVLALALTAPAIANAESHTVHFVNNCGFGTPMLIQGANVLSTGQDYTSQGPLSSAIAYLQHDNVCSFNGEHCSLLEMTMVNPTVPGGGSSADISLIPPHAFNVPVAFEFPQCSGTKVVCSDANCPTAFFHPDDTWVQRACQENNAGITITFCDGGSGAAPPAKPAPASSSTHAVAGATHVAAPIAPIAPSPTTSSLASPPPEKTVPVVHAPASSSEASAATPSPTQGRCNKSRAQRRAAASSDAVHQGETRAIYDGHLRRRHHAHGRRVAHGSTF